MAQFYELMKKLGHTATGDDIDLKNFTTPEDSEKQSLVLIMDKRHLRHKDAIRSRAWLVAEPLADAPLRQWMTENKISYALTDHPKKDLIRLIEIFYPENAFQPEIHPTALIAPGAVIGQHCRIGPYVVIGEKCQIGSHVQIGALSVIGDGVTIGDGTCLHTRVTIYDGCVIGKKVILHSGTVIGSDGFGYHYEQGRYIKIPHAGTVVIEDEVEIGALCAVDRGTLGATRIGYGSKLDNLIQIAHNVQIGAHTVIAAQAGIAGSTLIGDRVTIAGQAGIVGHITIGNGVTIGAQAGVIGSIPDGMTVSGYPAREHQQALRREAMIGKIPDLLQRIEAIETLLANLTDK